MAQRKRTTRNRGTQALSGLTRPDDIARLRSLLELSCDCAWEQDAEHRFIRWSDHRETRSETGRVDAVVGKTLWDLGWTPVTGSWNEHHLLRRAQQPFRNLLLAVGQHPFERYLSFSGTPRFSRSGTFVGYHGICQQRAGGDVLGQLIRQEREVHRLREREAYYANMVELAGVGICHMGLDGHFLDVNARLCEMLGYTRDELLALTSAQVSHPEDCGEPSVRLLSNGSDDGYQTERRYLTKSGAPIWVNLTVFAQRGTNGDHSHDISIVEDITARREAQSRVQYLATHDELTGLPNRPLFHELLTHAGQPSGRARRGRTVLLINLDRFKTVNDLIGREGGDGLLKEIAARLNRNVRATDILARFDGDEFALLASDLPNRQVAARLARKLLRLVVKPVQIGIHQCRVTASIGIAMHPDDGQAVDTLLKHAELAMERAKAEGKNNYCFYSPELSAASEQRVRLETALRGALERHEFSVHYQTRVDLRTREITGVEALLRWSHPELGAVPPSQFIPVAEECGVVIPIGLWVLTTACRQAMTWLHDGLPAIAMAVNLSPRQFLDPGLVDNIRRVLRETGMPPQMLELEITESGLLDDLNAAVAKMHALRTMGARVAIDDFGTGYSSLSHLKQFPVDSLKIDRSFIRGIPHDSDDVAITEAVLTLGRTLGVRIVAEGVETDEQRAFLEQHACHEVQGFFFSRPVPAETFSKMYHAYRAHAS